MSNYTNDIAGKLQHLNDIKNDIKTEIQKYGFVIGNNFDSYANIISNIKNTFDEDKTVLNRISKAILSVNQRILTNIGFNLKEAKTLAYNKEWKNCSLKGLWTTHTDESYKTIGVQIFRNGNYIVGANVKMYLFGLNTDFDEILRGTTLPTTEELLNFITENLIPPYAEGVTDNTGTCLFEESVLRLNFANDENGEQFVFLHISYTDGPEIAISYLPILNQTIIVRLPLSSGIQSYKREAGELPINSKNLVSLFNINATELV